MRVLVTGATGTLGRPVVRQLREAGHQALELSRRPGEGEDWRQGDLATGDGLQAAVAGVEAIVHAGSATIDPRRWHQTDVVGTERLLAAAAAAGVGHFVYVSIVGMEGVGYPYYKHKLAAEATVKGGPVPWSILRATQFHQLMEIFLRGFGKMPGLLPVPYRWRFQPVDPGEVAARLVQVATGPPRSVLPDFGGPEVRDFKSIASAWLAATGSAKRLLNLPIPLGFSRRFAEGRLLCPGHRDGKVTWEQYLARRSRR